MSVPRKVAHPDADRGAQSIDASGKDHLDVTVSVASPVSIIKTTKNNASHFLCCSRPAQFTVLRGCREVSNDRHLSHPAAAILAMQQREEENGRKRRRKRGGRVQ